MTTFAGGPLLLPPKMEVITRTYLTPLLGWPVVTKVPKPDPTAATIGGLLRVEAAGGTRVPPWNFQFDMTVLLHGYSPDEDEANDIANKACALMAVGRGQTINGFYIITVEDVGMPHRQTDPDVNLPRYMGTATWRVAGQPWTPTP